jgi:hypothetical protein
MIEDKVYLLEGKGKDRSLERSVSVEQGIEVKVAPSPFRFSPSRYQKG